MAGWKLKRARQMRANPTMAEWKLNQALRELTLAKVIPGLRHQHRILGYIVDIYCPKHRLIIEIDGEHHKRDQKQFEWDTKRDAVLARAGYMTIRFSNAQVLSSIDWVVAQVVEVLSSRPTWKNWNQVRPDGGTIESMAAHLDYRADRRNPRGLAAGNSTK